MDRPVGIHHLVLSTQDMKGQLTFFTEVLGMELTALFWMHGIEGAFHAFLKLNDHSSLALMYHPSVHDRAAAPGVSHAPHPGDISAPGTLQHLCFLVESHEELLKMRDRIRSHGIPVFGTVDHGICESMYFAGPEGLNLEIAVETNAMDPELWIDPEVVELCGISSEELGKMKKPEKYVGSDSPVPQPAFDPDKPHFQVPNFEEALKVSDEDYGKGKSYPEPPVIAAAREKEKENA